MIAFVAGLALEVIVAALVAKYRVKTRTDSVGKYHNAQKKLLAAGFRQRQDGDHEGTFTFDPENDVQAKLAIAVCGIKRQKVFTPEQIEAKRAIAANLNRARQQGQKTRPETRLGQGDGEKHQKPPSS